MHAEFSTLSDVAALMRDLPQPDTAARDAARARDAQLTKPPGALGQLEDLAIWYCGWRGGPRLDAPQVLVFAGNHGVVAQGISAFPPEVTTQMVANLRAGGAAVNQLAGVAGAPVDVHALDLDRPTGDITLGPALTEADTVAALRTGWQAVGAATDLLVVGEMGIGNTTSAAAIAHSLYGGGAMDWTGRGTGLDDTGLSHKARVVAQAVAVNAGEDVTGLEVLRRLGGRELAAMAGAILRARVARIPVMLDGFICTAAAACLAAVDAGALDHAIAGHVSAEPGHDRLLRHLGKTPLLSLGLRLGEGSGGVLAMGLVRSALACHAGMATFADAGVSEG